MNLFEIAWLTDEQVKMFKSDFGIVADYFVQMRKNNDYEPGREQIRHVDEELILLIVRSGLLYKTIEKGERKFVVSF